MRTQFTRINPLAILAVWCLFAFNSTPAQTPTAQQIALNVDEYMNAAMKVDGFSGSILVARDGQPVISKGYGMANYELNVPNSPQTVFRIGSITKSFTATAVMMLQERGKLNVNDSICKHLSDCPAAWQPVTIRHLLTHTSGITSFTDLPDYRKTRSLPVTPVELIGRIRDKPLEFAAGEKYHYSNSDFYLLGVVIERASGKSYEDFLQENIFKLLGMSGSGYDNSSRIIRNRAAGYEMQSDGTHINAPYIDMSIPFAGGALYSTVEDLLRFDRALYTEKLLPHKSLQEMFTQLKNEYGYGWEIRKRFDRQTIETSGSIVGFDAAIVRFPADRLTIIVLGNNGFTSAIELGNDLSAIVFGSPYEISQERKVISLDPKILEKYVGQYQLPSGVIINVTIENGKLMRQVGAQPKGEMFAVSETEFFQKVVDLRITFVTDAQGRVTGLLARRGNNEILSTKIK